MGLSADLLKQHGPMLEGRSILVKRAKPLPIECVIRGYLAGSGWKDYQKTGEVCGHRLETGLKQCQKLPNPIFTPATKAEVGHDENISTEKASELIGDDLTLKVAFISKRLYEEGAAYAAGKGILIADTKFEFGLIDKQLVLIDEVLTPDSSRFWPKDKYEVGRDQESFDKQIVRNFLESSGWKKTPPGPELPREVVEKTSESYKKAYELLTGKQLA